MKYVVVVGLTVLGFSLSTPTEAFIECDLDLNDPKILQQLPDECQNVDESAKLLLLKETESFKAFHKKLIDYEASLGLNTEDEIYMDMDFRRKLYTEAGLNECLDIVESFEDYVQCLVDKRTQMITTIDSKTSRNV